MKAAKFIFIPCFIFLFGTLQAQWLPTSGPEGGEINCMTRVGAEIWVGAPSGIYISANEGLSWQKSNFLSGTPVGSIYCSGDTIVVQFCQHFNTQSAYSPTALYKTTSSFDGGTTWSTPQNIHSAMSFYPNYMGKLYPCRSGLIYILNSGSASFISPDMGLTWSMTSLPVHLFPAKVIVDPNRLLIEAYDDSTNNRHLLLSEDLGQTWQQQSIIGRGYVWLTLDSVLLNTHVFDNPGVIHAAIMRSDDIGITWDTVFMFPPDFCNSLYINKGDTIYTVGYTDTTFVSYDKGLTWQGCNPPPDLFINSIYLSTGDQLYYEDRYINRYLVYQGSSVPSMTGFNGQTIDAIRTCNDKLYCSSGENVFRSEDGGQLWSKVCSLGEYQMYDPIIDIISTHDTLFCVNKRYLGRSFDDGINWDILPLPNLEPHWEASSVKLKGSRLYLSSDQVYYSDDYGLSWGTLPQLPPTNPPGAFYQNGYLEIHQNQLFIMTAATNIYRLDETINQWVACYVSNQGTDLDTKLLHSIDGILFLTAEFQFKYSLDGGNTWISPTNLGLPIHDQFYTYYPRNIQIYQGLWFGNITARGVYYSSDQGNNWNLLPGGTANFKPNCLGMQNNVLYAGSMYNGVWRRLGTFYTFSGRVFRDYNQNGQQEPGDTGLAGINLISTPTGWACTTDTTGDYTLFTDAYGDILKPFIPTGFYTLNPAFYITNGADSNQNFGVTPIPGIQDLSIDVTNVNIFRPGFQTLVNLNILNKGSVLQAPVAKFIMPAELSFQSSNPPPSNINGDTLTWQLNPLQFLESFDVELNVNTSIFALIGDSIMCSSFVFPVTGDSLPLDNQFLLKEEIQGSYDPNDKTCNQGEFFSPDAINLGTELEYTIRFQNTGNLSTVFVRVTDTLSPYLDVTSFRLIAGTQPLSYSIHSQRVVEFEFNPLELQPASINEPESMGFVKYAIKCKPNTQLGTAISNTAYIYFDFNPPIQTNTTTTVIANSITTQIFEPDNTISALKLIVYPNPANTYIHLEIEELSGTRCDLIIFDVSGKELLRVPVVNSKTIINTTEIPSGFYIGSLVSSSGLKLGTFKIMINR